ncbi:MAG TPA: hypothetical protein VJS13_04395, partial [Pyrinomonadaceae bacterium]|nr:hypothetical protein [Pyrinomonadaceae bacterium]
MRILAIALLLSSTSVQLLAQNATRGAVELITTLSGHTKSIEQIEFGRSGDVIATSSKDRTVRLWNVVSGECLATIAGDGAEPSKLNWSDDGRRLAITYRRDKTWEVVVWEAPANRLPIAGRRFPDAYFYEWSPDNRSFVALNGEVKLNIWDAVSGQLTQTLNPEPATYIVAFVTAGQRILTASDYGPVQLWDVATGKLVRSYPTDECVNSGNYPALLRPVLSPDKRVLLRGAVKNDSVEKSPHTYLTMREIDDGKELLTFQMPEGVQQIFWTPDGKTLAIVGLEFGPRLIDTATGRETARLPFENCWPWTLWGSDGCEPLSFNADGAVVLKAKEPIKLWDTTTVTLIAE